MRVRETALPEVLLIEPEVFEDERGFFFESFNARAFAAATGVQCSFVQDNHSGSRAGVLRGLHYQARHPQGKLVRVLTGRILDVAVDLRRSSVHYGRHLAVELEAATRQQLWIPPGFAHGFLVRSEYAEVQYKVTAFRHADDEHTLLWNDPALGIEWGTSQPLLSERDRKGRQLRDTKGCR